MLALLEWKPWRRTVFRAAGRAAARCAMVKDLVKADIFARQLKRAKSA